MINIRQLNDNEILSWVDFFVAPANDIGYIRWNFIDVHTKVPIIGAFDEDKPIGSKPAWFCPVGFNKKEYNVIQYRHTAVHEDYRRKGLFSNMTKLSLELYKNQNYDFIFNVSVPNSKLGYEKLNWQYYEGFQRLMKLNLSIFKFSKKNNQSNFLLENHLERMNTINSKTQNLFKDRYTILKDEKYIKWRYSKPTKEYYCVSNKDIGYISFQFEMKKNLRVLYIGDVRLINNDRKNFIKLYKLIKETFHFHIATVLISVGHPHYSILKKSLFLTIRQNLNFGIRPLKENLSPQIFDLRNWAITSIDIDTF